MAASQLRLSGSVLLAASPLMSPHINSKVVSTNCRGVASQHHGSSRLECTNNSSQQLFISFFSLSETMPSVL